LVALDCLAKEQKDQARVLFGMHLEKEVSSSGPTALVVEKRATERAA
jgi:hypothetical protein